MSRGERVALIVVGVCLIMVLFAWLLIRPHEPFATWGGTDTPLGVVLQVVPWICCVGGAWIIAYAVTADPHDVRYEADEPPRE